MTRYPAECLPLQSLTERLRRLPGLFVADVGIADCGADILVPEELLNFPQILSHVVKENRGRTMAQSMGCDLPHPEGSARSPQPQVERPVGKRRTRISRKHKRRPRKGDSSGARTNRGCWSCFASIRIGQNCLDMALFDLD
jgi:hypothetical protein